MCCGRLQKKNMPNIDKQTIEKSEVMIGLKRYKYTYNYADLFGIVSHSTTTRWASSPICTYKVLCPKSDICGNASYSNWNETPILVWISGIEPQSRIKSSFRAKRILIEEEEEDEGRGKADSEHNQIKPITWSEFKAEPYREWHTSVMDNMEYRYMVSLFAQIKEDCVKEFGEFGEVIPPASSSNLKMKCVHITNRNGNVRICESRSLIGRVKRFLSNPHHTICAVAIFACRSHCNVMTYVWSWL